MSGLQKKTINAYLQKQINFWAWSIHKPSALKTILDLKLTGDELSDEDKTKISNFQQQVIDNTIVTGGAIASMLLGEEVNDLDVYIKDKEVARKLAQYYLNVMIETGNLNATDYVKRIEIKDNHTDGIAVFIKSQGIAGDQIDTANYDYFEAMTLNKIDQFFEEYRKAKAAKADDKSHTVKIITSNAITLRSGIQIILRFCGEPERIHKNYDFVHATNYWTHHGGVVYNEAALQALLERRLVYVGSLFPVASMFRLRKFIQRGFHITAGEMTKIAWDISHLDLTNKAVLHDQLIGVDYAYFGEVLRLLRDRETDIDRTYLFSILNEIFADEGETGASEIHTDPSDQSDVMVAKLE